MVEPSDEPKPEDEDGEGGAVKSFLEHLEDLRWMLIKSAAATLVGMLFCLFAVNHLTAILRWPLERARHRRIAFMPEDTNTILHLRFGSTPLQAITLTTNQLGPFNLGTNGNVTLQLEPVQIGTNTLLALRPVEMEANTDEG